MSLKHFDYIIIGNGLAGLKLANTLAEDTYFNNKQIALIDKTKKTKNDKTWSFWEKNNTYWDDLVSKSWHEAVFYSSKKITINLKPYEYKSIKSIDFYSKIIANIKSKNNFHFIEDTVTTVTEKQLVTVHTKTKKYTTTHVFDSRIPEPFFSKKNNFTTIQQHFKGYIIETKKDVFNTKQFTIMDYRLKDNNQTTFTYVLPLNKNKALIEFTYFTTKLVDDNTYNYYLKEYISNILNITDYKVLEEEKGNIPMSTFPFHKYSTKNITKIGTAGGWVKASSGYSFKNSDKKINQIILNIKNGKHTTYKLYPKKYLFYDKVFLQVLKDNNEKGEWIFKQFYSKNKPEIMFKFLDEESNLLDDLKIMLSLFSFSFIKAFFKTI